MQHVYTLPVKTVSFVASCPYVFYQNRCVKNGYGFDRYGCIIINVA